MRLALLLVLIALAAVSPAVAQAPNAADSQADRSVQPDGALNLAGAPAGALDLAGLRGMMGEDGQLRAGGVGGFSDISSGPNGAPLDDIVNALAVGSDGTVYAGGSFTRAGGPGRSGVVRRGVGTTAWEPLGTGMDGPVLALAVAPDGSIYAGGARGAG
ncbi:MAG TPA: hypothetical protein VGB53_17035 [Rubricoccaceae bacterium]|jgi:hypothetical protein